MTRADTGGLVRRLAGPVPAVGADGTARRVVMVHPGAIPVQHYSGLAANLSPGHEMLVVDVERVAGYFQAALVAGPPATTIQEIAEEIVAALRELPPAPGSWVLAGWSFGGTLCPAVIDLLAEHERPGHVVVLDALAPVPEFTAAEEDELDPRVVLGWFATYLAAKRGGEVAVEAERLRELPFDAGLRAVLAAAVAGGGLRPDTTASGLRKVFDAYRNGMLRNNRLVRTHHSRHCPVPLTLLRPEHGLVQRPGALGWDLLTLAPQVLRCPGDHYTMLRAPESTWLFAGLVSGVDRVRAAAA